MTEPEFSGITLGDRSWNDRFPVWSTARRQLVLDLGEMRPLLVLKLACVVGVFPVECGLCFDAGKCGSPGEMLSQLEERRLPVRFFVRAMVECSEETGCGLHLDCARRLAENFGVIFLEELDRFVSLRKNVRACAFGGMKLGDRAWERGMEKSALVRQRLFDGLGSNGASLVGWLLAGRRHDVPFTRCLQVQTEAGSIVAALEVDKLPLATFADALVGVGLGNVAFNLAHDLGFQDEFVEVMRRNAAKRAVDAADAALVEVERAVESIDVSDDPAGVDVGVSRCEDARSLSDAIRLVRAGEEALKGIVADVCVGDDTWNEAIDNDLRRKIMLCMRNRRVFFDRLGEEPNVESFMKQLEKTRVKWCVLKENLLASGCAAIALEVAWDLEKTVKYNAFYAKTVSVVSPAGSVTTISHAEKTTRDDVVVDLMEEEGVRPNS